jgi:gamma-glutamylputrescine oxidase
VVANGFTVRAEAVVLCVDRFLPEFDLLSNEVFHIQTFLAVSAPLSDSQRSAIFPDSPLMVWDSDLIYQYFRLTGDNRLLLGASSLRYTYARKHGEVASGIVRKMRALVRRKFPHTPLELEYFWPGLLGVSKDFLPILGQAGAPPRTFFAGAGAGLPWAAALGEYVADKITEGRDELDGTLSPDRSFPVGARLHRLLGKPLSFALSHAAAKYLRH